MTADEEQLTLVFSHILHTQPLRMVCGQVRLDGLISISKDV